MTLSQLFYVSKYCYNSFIYQVYTIESFCSLHFSAPIPPPVCLSLHQCPQVPTHHSSLAPCRHKQVYFILFVTTQRLKRWAKLRSMKVNLRSFCSPHPTRWLKKVLSDDIHCWLVLVDPLCYCLGSLTLVVFSATFLPGWLWSYRAENARRRCSSAAQEL